MKNSHIKLMMSLLIFSNIKAQESAPSLEALESQPLLSFGAIDAKPYTCPACIFHPATSIKETVETCCYNGNKLYCKPASEAVEDHVSQGCNAISMTICEAPCVGEIPAESRCDKCQTASCKCFLSTAQCVEAAQSICCYIACRPIYIVGYTVGCGWLSEGTVNNENNN